MKKSQTSKVEEQKKETNKDKDKEKSKKVKNKIKRIKKRKKQKKNLIIIHQKKLHYQTDFMSSAIRNLKMMKFMK